MPEDNSPLIEIDKPDEDITNLQPSEDQNPITKSEIDELDNVEVQQVNDHLNNSDILSADIVAEVKRQVTAEIMADLKEDKVLKNKEIELRRELEDIEYANYVALKMESDDPWVDFVGDVRDTEKGQRLELNWNPAFVVFLKSIGITGVDEEQIVQKYISLLLRDMVDKNEERYGSDYE